MGKRDGRNVRRWRLVCIVLAASREGSVTRLEQLPQPEERVRIRFHCLARLDGRPAEQRQEQRARTPRLFGRVDIGATAARRSIAARGIAARSIAAAAALGRSVTLV